MFQFKQKDFMYVAMVRSVISYYTFLWAPYTKKDLISIEQIQRHATRYICKYTDLTYVDRLNVCNLLPL